ncbi:MAG: hypothetical protein H7062_11195 [Candidatus Saccharimonas sp.]|nr:hypothetical protein [Planctomycetaceae bacterium]
MNNVEVTAAVVDALNAEQIDYMLVGAFSSNAYGVARSTHDADFVVVVKPGQLRALVDRLGSDFTLDPQIQMEGITGSLRNVITYIPSSFQIDFFRLNTKDEHHEERFRRRCLRPVEELQRSAWLPTPEDVVIQKLRWQRRKDLDDVVNVLAVSGPGMDWDYLNAWAQKHGTYSLLQDLMKEAAIVPNS